MEIQHTTIRSSGNRCRITNVDVQVEDRMDTRDDDPLTCAYECTYDKRKGKAPISKRYCNFNLDEIEDNK